MMACRDNGHSHIIDDMETDMGNLGLGEPLALFSDEEMLPDNADGPPLDGQDLPGCPVAGPA